MFQKSLSYAFLSAYPARVASRYLMATCFFFGTETCMLALKEGYIGLLLQVMRHGDKQNLEKSVMFLVKSTACINSLDLLERHLLL